MRDWTGPLQISSMRTPLLSSPRLSYPFLSLRNALPLEWMKNNLTHFRLSNISLDLKMPVKKPLSSKVLWVLLKNLIETLSKSSERPSIKSQEVNLQKTKVKVSDLSQKGILKFKKAQQQNLRSHTQQITFYQLFEDSF